MSKETVVYRGEIIEKFGKGFLYDSIAWPQWELLTVYIDNKLAKRN